jgi:putative lipase involved disintegration of autophagic bodies
MTMPSDFALGSPYGAQAQLTIRFYQQVEQLYPDANIMVTGHSLGGGLAGLVGSLYHLNGVLFDNMPLENVAEDAYVLATWLKAAVRSPGRLHLQ